MKSIYGNDFYETGKLQDVIERFIDGSEKVKEYVYAEKDYIDSYSAANSLRSSIKRSGYCSVKVSCRKGKVYLIKKF